jgi:phosphatidate cytidylyltransferase
MTTPSSPRSERRAAGADSGTRPSRAGRDVPIAIGVGVSLGVVVLASLIFRKQAFLGGQALTVCFGLTCISVLLWRVCDGLQDAIRDIAGGIFVAAYVPLLASFSSLLLAAPDGAKRVCVFIIVTISSDIGGFAVGVMAGKHPMAPSVSPKKSWEGAGGSALACVIAGVASVMVILGGSWSAGAALGLAVVVSATVGDLTESTIKRDLGIKDMGSILPGHGGFMDRMDSLLLSAPVAWALLTVLVPFAVVPVA